MLLIIVMHDSKFFSEVSFSSYLHFHPQSGKLFEVLECFFSDLARILPAAI